MDFICQIMEKEGTYYKPKFKELRENELNIELSYTIDKLEEQLISGRFKGFVFNGLIIVHYKCGHYEPLQIFIEPGGSLYEKAKQLIENSNMNFCTTCILGGE